MFLSPTSLSFIEKVNILCNLKSSESYHIASDILSSIITTIFSTCVTKESFECKKTQIRRFSAIELAHIEMKEFLGDGTFGCVFSAIHEGMRVAVKLNKSKTKDDEEFLTEDSLAEIKNEAETLQILNENDPEDMHNIVRLKGFGFLDPKTFCLVTDRYEMDLHDFLHKETTHGLPLSRISKIALELFSTLAYFRQNNIIHCDLKPRNILVQQSGELSDKSFKLRIGDFGSAVSSPQSNALMEYKVTRPYRASDIALGTKYDHSIDLWAVGCILFELHTKRVLFNAKDNLELIKMFIQLMGPIPEDVINFNVWKKHLVPSREQGRFIIPLRPHESIYLNTLEQFSNRLSPKASIWSLHRHEGVFHTEEVYGAFKNLLSQIFRWKERPSVEELQSHSFFSLIEQIQLASS
jgi:serine/threonine protein kinase